VDDTPEAVLLSSFDPVRREIARVALNRLILDGRSIRPGSKRSSARPKKKVEQDIREAASRPQPMPACRAFIPRSSDCWAGSSSGPATGKNQLQHSIEVAHLAAMLAAEVGANVQITKAGALLHDLGKAIDHEVEGAHALIGADLAKRYGVPAAIVNSIAGHTAKPSRSHWKLSWWRLLMRYPVPRQARGAIGRRVYQADQSPRDGGELLQRRRRIVCHPSRREIRIIVKPEQIDDLAAIQLSKDIAKAVEKTWNTRVRSRSQSSAKHGPSISPSSCSTEEE